MCLFLGTIGATAQTTAPRFKTIVIDAGHGGKDPGCVSRDKKTYEKTLTLDISRQLADLIEKNIPDVKVILSRSDDRFVSLNDRADKANGKNADLFISLHINATTSTSTNGFSVHVLGQSSNSKRDLYAGNLEMCRRENSVILLEDDYSTKYQGFNPNDTESYIFMTLMQSAYLQESLVFANFVSEKLSGGPIARNRGIYQDPFYVLWKTSMPSVLVELGFISNPQDLTQLRSADKRKELSRRLYEAIKQYIDHYNRTLQIETGHRQTTPSPAASDNSDVTYGTQIFAGKNLLYSKDPKFLGYPFKAVKSGSVYKYVIGLSKDEREAVENFKKIRQKYPESFMVLIEDDEIRRK